MTEPIDDEAVYRVVEEERDFLSRRPLGVWPALIASKLKIDGTQVLPALLRLQDAGRVHEIDHCWYPGILPEPPGEPLQHLKTVRMLLAEAWGFIAVRHPREEWPAAMCEMVDALHIEVPPPKGKGL